MQANAVGVSRSDVSGTAFTYFLSFFLKKKKKKEWTRSTWCPIKQLNPGDGDYFY